MEGQVHGPRSILLSTDPESTGTEYIYRVLCAEDWVTRPMSNRPMSKLIGQREGRQRESERKKKALRNRKGPDGGLCTLGGKRSYADTLLRTVHIILCVRNTPCSILETDEESGLWRHKTHRQPRMA